MKAEKLTGFAKRLSLVRLSFGCVTGRPNLSRAKFAAELGLEYETYARYERAETVPQFAGLIAIRKLTGVSLDYLVTGEDGGFTDPLAVFGECQAQFGERLRYVRELMEPDDGRAAQLMDVSLATYRGWESGRIPMPDAKLEEFAHRFSASLPFLQQGRPEGLPLLLLEQLLKTHPGLWHRSDTGRDTDLHSKARAAASHT